MLRSHRSSKFLILPLGRGGGNRAMRELSALSQSNSSPVVFLAHSPIEPRNSDIDASD